MPQALPSKPPQAPWRESLIWLGFGVIAWFILKLLAPVLTPFVIALVLAYSLAPLVQMLHRCTKRRLPHGLVVVVVELGFILIVLAVVLLIVPILGKELPMLQAKLPRLVERLNAVLSPVLTSLGMTYSLDPASIKSLVVNYLETNASDVWMSVLPSLKLGGGVLLTVLGLVVLVPVVLFYLLNDWANMLQRTAHWIPRAKLPQVQSFIKEADAVLGQYMRGQLLVMVVLAIFYSAGLALWGLDLALPIGVFTGLAMCIPYIGFGIGLILALLAGVLQFDVTHTAFMLATVYGMGQVLEGFFLTPRLVGERIGLHPLAVIFALLAFGQLFGFIGVLVALPVSAVLLVALRRLRAHYLASHLYQA
ncbi:MAG: AI-2E family transporter [Cytophagales bacterium]|nr:AI-2E family transporter [Cytophagales bacterium]